MKKGWMVWILLFALLLVLVSAKKSGKGKSGKSGKSDKDTGKGGKSDKSDKDDKKTSKGGKSDKSDKDDKKTSKGGKSDKSDKDDKKTSKGGKSDKSDKDDKKTSKGGKSDKSDKDDKKTSKGGKSDKSDKDDKKTSKGGKSSKSDKDTGKGGKSSKSDKGTGKGGKSSKSDKDTGKSSKSSKSDKGTGKGGKSSKSDKDTGKSSKSSKSDKGTGKKGSKGGKGGKGGDGKKWKPGKGGKKSDRDPRKNEKFEKGGKKGGWRKNKDRRNPKYGCECSANGDPHFRTCDRREYDFQGACTYTFVRDGCWGAEQTFEVLISTEPWRNKKATVTKRVQINLYRNGEIWHEFVLERKRGEGTADGVQCVLPRMEQDAFEVRYERDAAIFVLLPDEDLRLEWNYERNLMVKLSDKYREKVCGLCGNYNGKKNDDYVLLDNSVLNEGEEHIFGEKWRALVDTTTEECQPELQAPVDPCEEITDEDKSRVLNFIREFEQGVWQDCTSSEEEQEARVALIQNLRFDFCLDPSVYDMACEYAQKYAEICIQIGKLEEGNWRRPGFCEQTQCTGGKIWYDIAKMQKDQVYGDRFCSDPADELSADNLIPGCYCPKDMFLDGASCVTIEACGCSLRGMYLKRGQEVVDRFCQTRYICGDNGDMVEEPMSCDENARCKGPRGEKQCVCSKGFQGDGKTCERVENPNTIGVGNDGELPESSFTSSSDDDGTVPWYGRLDHKESCWKPKASDDKPWLRVSLLEKFLLKGVRLQGCPTGDCSISEFTVYYSEDGKNFKKADKFKDVKIEGNFEDFLLNEPVKDVQYVKISPKNENGCVGLRMEVIGERSNCQKNWKTFGRSCYLFKNKEYNYERAQQFCSDKGGYLAEVFDEKENDFISRLAKGKEILLGISDVNHQGEVINEHGPNGRRWLNFPVDLVFNAEDECVVMTAEGDWRYVNCGEKRRLVCEDGGGNDCPDDWEKLEGGCYKLLEEKLPFIEAVEKCHEIQGHLVDISSPEENIAVADISGGEKVWLSVSDVKDEGAFKVYPSGREFAFSSWAANEPNDWGDGEDCAVMNWNARAMWNDVPCLHSYRVVCEFGRNKHHKILDVCKGNPCNGGVCFGLYNPVTEKASHICKCRSGTSGATCSDNECNCFGWGDPHFGTCDGLEFNYQGKCSYVMAQNGCKDPSKRTFQVVVSTQDFPKYPGTTSCKTIYIYMDYWNGIPKTVIRLDQGRKCYRNDELIETDFSLANKAEVFRRGGKIIFVHPYGLHIAWNGDKRVDFKMDGSLAGEVCGFCGDFDGDPSNDILDINSNNKPDKDEIEAFGDKWAFGKDCDPPGTPEPIEELCAKAGEEVQTWIKLYEDLTEKEDGLFHQCDEKKIEQIKNELRMEVCSSRDISGFCQAMQNLQTVCEDFIGLICWDTEKLCVPEMKKNEDFFCGSYRELSCEEEESEVAITLYQPVSGVFCKKGFYRMGERCVPKSECGCKYTTALGEKRVIRPGEVASDCTTEYTCIYKEDKNRYKLKKNKLSCHPDAECGTNGRCQCKELFSGDGFECKYEGGPDLDELEGYKLGFSCRGWRSAVALEFNPLQVFEAATIGRLCKKDDFFIAEPDQEDPYIILDLTVKTPVTAIITRGWRDGQCWPSSVSVMYSKDGDEWVCDEEEGGACKKYQVSFQERVTVIKPIRARYVKIIPQAEEGRRICLQVDLFGGDPVECNEEDGFERVGPFCYRLFNKKKTYDGAVATCNKFGAYLVEISTKKESRLLQQLVGETPIFIGMIEEGSTGRFFNPRGSSHFYSNYAPQEPNVMMTTAKCIRSYIGLWYREECSQKLEFVCEYGGDALDKVPKGNRLGISIGGSVRNPQLTASSFVEGLEPFNGRLDKQRSAWSPNPEDVDEPYIQIDLLDLFKITAIETQGRGDKPAWTKRFTVKYSTDCNEFLTLVDDEGKAVKFAGNSDQETRMLNILERDLRFKARCVRIYPRVGGKGLPEFGIALRFELWGIFQDQEKPCMKSLLEDVETIPDSSFVSSSCLEEADTGLNLGVNYCAKDARWAPGSPVGWSPGSGGHYQFIQVDLGIERIVKAIRVRAVSGTVPAFRVIGSPDGKTFRCLDYKKDVEIFPESEETEVEYKLRGKVPLQIIRISPVCEGIPVLQIDILGCDMERLQVEIEDFVLEQLPQAVEENLIA